MDQVIVKKIPDEEINIIVDKIVDKWNEMVTDLQNTTIKLCLMIKDMMQTHPELTIKDVLHKVKTHPNIKQFVSIDRIWQGMRLVHNRPELIEYTKKDEEEKSSTGFKQKPYLKKDGEIFWEFYFELEKAPLNPLTRNMLEVEGKENLWSFRTLRQKIQETRDELGSPTDLELRRREKEELIRTISGILRGFKVEKLRDAKKLLEALRRQNTEEINKKVMEDKNVRKQNKTN